MSYHEGSNWQARKEDEGKPLYESLTKEDLVKAVHTSNKWQKETETYLQRIEKALMECFDSLRDIDLYADVADPPFSSKQLAEIARKSIGNVIRSFPEIMQIGKTTQP